MMGALHPVLFFMLVYGISLFLAFFVCRTVYYSINGEEMTNSTSKETFGKKMEMTTSSVNVTALR
jgi:uncharacterized protein YabE (DUF348 family)